MKPCSLRSQTNIWIPKGQRTQVYSFLSLLCPQVFPAETYPGQGIMCFIGISHSFMCCWDMESRCWWACWLLNGQWLALSYFLWQKSSTFSLSSLPSLKNFGGLLLHFTACKTILQIFASYCQHNHTEGQAISVCVGSQYPAGWGVVLVSLMQCHIRLLWKADIFRWKCNF